MSKAPQSNPIFHELGLSAQVLDAVTKIGYESPSPIQAEAIPPLLEGRDILGQAQTGTGKTAAFALPLLSQIDLKQKHPQVLVLAPTRELAIQVSEAFQKYAMKMNGFRVVPIYGGQDYRQQFRALDRGVHVVVGTPGRVMDHMRRGSLVLSDLRCLVLDEADEMLRMGFIDDVEWVLEQIPNDHQIALFSATMPKEISRIAQTYLNDPVLVSIKVKTSTVETVQQRFWMVSGLHKLDALTRILEVEDTDGIIIFVRTKIQTVELSEKLAARGYAASALNGDIAQKMRELTVNKFKSGKLDILVATDVAARGLDVPRISHVINYDVPHDTESYIHRIGRTARAGRRGDAILFVSPRERRMLHAIERATRQKIEQMDLPSHDAINDRRIERFKQRITDTLGKEEDLEFYGQVIESYRIEHDIPAIEIAAALASMTHGESSLLLKKPDKRERKTKLKSWDDEPPRSRGRDRGRERDKPQRSERSKGRYVEPGMASYRLAVGRMHAVKPINIVSAIANITGLTDKDIGRIDIQDDYCTIELPGGLHKEILQALSKTKVCGQSLQIKLLAEGRSKHTPRGSGKSIRNKYAKKDGKRKPKRSHGKSHRGSR